jgi:uncharacterized membrane protein YgcG
MRISLFGLVASFLAGCAISAPAEEQETAMVTAQAVPRSNGSFRGHYVVPSPANLANAALFNMPEVDWTVTAGVATLHYDLPVGLVGGDLSVSLSGPLPSGATSVHLTSASGTGSCTALGTTVTCSEQLANLGALPISQTIVTQVAATDYPGPASDRIAVASLFSSDPIGTVDFDISQPSPDDGGGGGGGGGGHGGGGGGGGHGPH